MCVGLFGLVGPPDPMHHWLHKEQAFGIFGRCCCIQGSDHAECGWSDHAGHAWIAHGKIANVALAVVFGGIVTVLVGLHKAVSVASR